MTVEVGFIKASHILVQSKDILEKLILPQIEAGQPFDVLAKVYSTCPSKQNGGDLGMFSKGRMVKEFEEAAFALQPGEVSGIVQTQFGFHVIKRTE